MEIKPLLRIIYSWIPLKKEFFLLLKKWYRPNENILKHLHFNNSFFKVEFENNKSFLMYHNGTILENQVFWKGIPNGWEKYSMSSWLFLSSLSKVVFDIGANTGLYSLVAKTQNPNAKVYAFEPIPKVYSQLIKNISFNESEIQTYNVAFSNYNGKGFFWDDNNDHLLSVTLNEDKNFYQNSEDRSKIEVKVNRLDSFIVHNKISNLDLLKIDTEYHDSEVLEGLGEILNSYRPNILIEVLTDQIAEKINRLIYSLDYKVFLIDEENGFIEENSVKKSPDFNVLLLNENEINFFRKQFVIN